MSSPPGEVRAESDYLRLALALRRRLQAFLDENAGSGQHNWCQFTLGDGTWYPVTRPQRKILMRMAPDDVRQANEKENNGSP